MQRADAVSGRRSENATFNDAFGASVRGEGHLPAFEDARRRDYRTQLADARRTTRSGARGPGLAGVRKQLEVVAVDGVDGGPCDHGSSGGYVSRSSMIQGLAMSGGGGAHMARITPRSDG